MKFSHMVTPPFNIGEEVTAACGEVFVARMDMEDAPVCRGCFDLAMREGQAVIDELSAALSDRAKRLGDILDAIYHEDGWGPFVYLPAEVGAKIANAVYRPGPGLPEGPEKEDGTF